MIRKYSPTSLIIDLQIIEDNYLFLKSQLKPGTKCGATVKCDAYGLGAKNIAATLYAAGCDDFFVANLEEAIELRPIIPNASIYVLGGILPGEEQEMLNLGAIPVINNFYQLEIWQNFAKICEKQLDTIIHIDTGINRVGFNIKDAEDLLERDLDFFNLKYVMSHLASSEEEDNEFNEYQRKLFDKFLSFEAPMSLSNSGGIFLGHQFHYDLVRPGAALYGLRISKIFPKELKNPVTLVTKIIHINEMIEDGTVGYNQTYKAKKGSKFATLPIGYGDGISRSMSKEGYCVIAGQRAPIAGLVSMDYLVIDVTHIDPAHIYLGAEVELIGKKHDCMDFAEASGITGYQVITSIGKRYKRIYKDCL